MMISVQSQELLLRYSFDESETGSADAADLGVAPPAPGTFVGATRIANTPGGFSKAAINLTGATADDLKYVTGGDAAKLDGLEAFTLTAWINVQEVPVGNRRILAKQSGGSFDGFSWNVNDPEEGERSAANFGLRLFVGGEKAFAHDLSGPRVSIDAENKWAFVAVTYDGRLEADNVVYYTGSVTDAVSSQATTTIDAGRTKDSDARFTVSHTDAALAANTALQGWIDDVRVYSGVLDASQLNAVRLENLPVAPMPTLLLRYSFDESETGSADAADLGIAPPAPGTFVGATRIANTPGGFSKAAINLTGATAEDLKYVTGGDAAKLDGLETFTLTAWINVQDVPVGNRRILAKQSGGSFDGFSWNVNDPEEGERSAANFGLRLFVGGEKAFAHDLSGPRVSIDAENKWAFVAVTYDGRLEADNVVYYTGSVTDAVSSQATTTIDAGRTKDSDARFTVSHTDAALAANTALQGWIDDVRVYGGVLDASQLNAVRLENLSAGSLPEVVRLTNPRRSGQTFAFDFQSSTPATYTIQFKDDLSQAVWQSLQTVPGTGQIITVRDETATPNARFYQVKSE